MSIRKSLLPSLVLAAATAIGCHESPPTAPGPGRIELGISATHYVASREPLRGSFEVLGLDSAHSVRLRVHADPYETLTAELPGGAYSLTWHPETSFERGSADPQLAALAGAPQMIVIAPARVTRVAVRFTPADVQGDVDERLSRR